jgi:hypothetical protein
MVDIDYERVKTVSSVVQLTDVLLTHCHWQSSDRNPRLSIEPETMAFSFGLEEATWDFSELRVLEVDLRYRLTAFAQAQGEGEHVQIPLFDLECAWQVSFGVPDDFEPSSADVLADFAAANGQLNAFPYVRQFVQDMTGRAGWPPLVLPTFRIPAKRPKAIGGRRTSSDSPTSDT